MSETTDDSAKRRSPKIVLMLGIIWVALGLFGLAFDPSNRLMGIIQLALGSCILLYYVWAQSR